MNLDMPCGPDDIPARLLKQIAAQIAPSRCPHFNKFCAMALFRPDDWKLANVVPFFKHAEKDEVENYRLISLLALVSKTLECCVFNNIKHQRR